MRNMLEKLKTAFNKHSHLAPVGIAAGIGGFVGSVASSLPGALSGENLQTAHGQTTQGNAEKISQGLAEAANVVAQCIGQAGTTMADNPVATATALATIGAGAALHRRARYILQHIKGERTPESDAKTALHESAHALLATLHPSDRSVKSVTILPDNNSMGSLSLTKGGDFTRTQGVNDLACTMAAKIAEEMEYGEHSSGCVIDIKDATSHACYMVKELGMGKTTFGKDYTDCDILDMLSDHSKDVISRDIDALLAEASGLAEKTLRENWDAVLALQTELLEKKTIGGKRVEEIIDAAIGKRKPETNTTIPATSAEPLVS